MRSGILTSVFLFFSFWGFAQRTTSSTIPVNLTLPEVALLDIEPNNSAVAIHLPAPTIVGEFIKKTENLNAKWLNYTSAVTIGKYRNITVQIEYGGVPAGTKIGVMASSASGGSGAMGSSNGWVMLSNAPQRIVNSIGGAFTGNGANAGHPLSYFLEVTEVSNLNFDASGTLGLVFTLIDN
jgi:hypothetical protein